MCSIKIQLSNIFLHPGIQSSEWDKEHAKHYIDYIDSTFTSEGHVPNMAEAEEVSLAFNFEFKGEIYK